MKTLSLKIKTRNSENEQLYLQTIILVVFLQIH
jgi:hypothetical protein